MLIHKDGKIVYDTAIIYEVRCIDENILDFFVGSSSSLATCKQSLKNGCYKYRHYMYNSKLSQCIRDNGGLPNWSVTVLRTYANIDKHHLLKKERKYIRKLQPSLNEIMKPRNPQNVLGGDRITCACGSVVIKKSVIQHEKTDIHQTFLYNQSKS